MSRKRLRGLVLAATLTLAIPLALSGGAGQAAPARRQMPAHDAPLASSIAVAWQRIAIRTVYTEGAVPPFVGSLYLAFTSLAVHDAAREAQRHGTHAAAAAVAQAAHDVLYQYFTGSQTRTNLDADLTASLAMVPDGKKQTAGVSIGEAAADEMIASRVGDGRNDASIVYNLAPAPGIWQPAPVPGGMAAAWLGFVDPVVDIAPVPLDGPDLLASAAWAADYNEVRALGNVGSATRTSGQTATAQFFTVNPVFQLRDALCRYLDAEPLGLLPTTRMFARMDAAIATTFIRTWRLKYDVGFWRPSEAIALALTDGNPATDPQAGWVPLVANPAYSEYTSGHGSATSPFAEVLRQTLGDSTPLLLKSGTQERTYSTLTALEHDALNARVWGGLHYRDGMEDTYHLGHETAHRVMAVIH